MCLIGSSSVNSFGKLYTQGIWLWDYEIYDKNIFQDFNISHQFLLVIVGEYWGLWNWTINSDESKVNPALVKVLEENLN